MQTPALQQPVGQLVASHTHAPPEHRWPTPQVGFIPHLQVPLEQLSAPNPQLVQVPPALPHSVAVGGLTQLRPEQHPVVQLAEEQLQLPALHA